MIKRIAINAIPLLLGGGQTHLVNLLKRADEFPDMKIYVLSPPQSADLYSIPGIDVITCNVPMNNILQRALWEKRRIPKILEELQADLVFCPGGIINFRPPENCSTAAAFQNMLIFDSASRRKYPFGFRRARLSVLEKISRRTFTKADMVIFLSEFAKETIDNKLPNRKGLSVVIPHGLDDSFRTAGRKDIPRSGFIPDGEYLLYVSYLHAIKTQLEIVRAFQVLCRERRTGEKLLLVGAETEPYSSAVRKEIKNLGLKDRVIITGQIPYNELPSVYHHAKAHIYASSCENCPNIVLESLGSGRPIFLSSKGPMPELAGDAAVYFDPFNPDELAGLLLKHLDDQQWMNEMGEKAYDKSFSYDWEQASRKTFNSIREVCT